MFADCIVIIASVSIDINAAILIGIERIKDARIDKDWLILVIRAIPWIIFENDLKITAATFMEQRRWMKEEQEEEEKGVMLLGVVKLVGLAVMQVVASICAPNNYTKKLRIKKCNHKLLVLRSKSIPPIPQRKFCTPQRQVT